MNHELKMSVSVDSKEMQSLCGEAVQIINKLPKLDRESYTRILNAPGRLVKIHIEQSDDGDVMFRIAPTHWFQNIVEAMRQTLSKPGYRIR